MINLYDFFVQLVASVIITGLIYFAIYKLIIRRPGKENYEYYYEYDDNGTVKVIKK